MHASFLQRKAVPSATSDGNAPSERENSVISANHKGSIKQTNTSQVLVSETVPDRRVQPSRRTKMTRFGDNPVTSTVPIPPRRQPGCDTSTRNRREFKLNVTDPDLLIPIKQTRVITTRHSDLREPQPSSSDSHLPVRSLYRRPPLVSLQCLCPVPHLAAQAQRAPVQVAQIVLRLRHHLRAAHSRSSNASSPETSSSASTSRSTSPKLLEMERSFNSLLAGTRHHQGPSRDQKSNGQLERPTTAYHHTEASCQSATEPTTAHLSTSSCKHATSPVSPKTSK